MQLRQLLQIVQTTTSTTPTSNLQLQLGSLTSIVVGSKLGTFWAVLHQVLPVTILNFLFYILIFSQKLKGTILFMFIVIDISY